MNDPSIRKLSISSWPERDRRAEDPSRDVPNVDGADNPNKCISDADGDRRANNSGIGSQLDRNGGANNSSRGADNSSKGVDDSNIDKQWDG